MWLFHFTKWGDVRVDLRSFVEALLVAVDLKIAVEAVAEHRPRKLTCIATVNKKNQIVIGTAYARLMDLTPGDEFEIKLGYKHIHLMQIANNNNIDDVNEEVSLAA